MILSAIVATGVISGAAGLLTTVVLQMIQHLGYGYTHGPLLSGVRAASLARHLAAPAMGCVLAGAGWWLLRRRTTVPRLGESIRGGARFAHTPMALDAVLQVLAVGSGASLGREQAPRLFAAAGTELLLRTPRAHVISATQRQVLLGSAAGAGLAAVYDVPVAGALFAVGIVLRSWHPTAVLAAVATSAIATLTAWPLSHGAPSFAWPPTPVDATTALGALVVIPLSVLVGMGFTWLITRARPAVLPTSWTQIPLIGLTGLLTGLCSIWLPLLPGNGKSIVLETLTGTGTLITFAAALVLKPVFTALFLRAGAVGGVLTPALSTGVALGTVTALGANHVGAHVSVATLALVAGAAVLAVTQRAPLFATVFTGELTHPALHTWAILLVAAVASHVIRRHVGRRHGRTS